MCIRDRCPYCGERTKRAVTTEVDDDYAMAWRLLHCPWCAYWCYVNFSNLGNGRIEWWCWQSKARAFAVDLPDGCEVELALGLRRDATLWDAFDPGRFE